MRDSYAGLSYDEVVHTYAQAVASACLMRLGSYADAEDCFQNTFLKLYTSSPSFESPDHLKAWLLRVAINECRSVLRARGRVIPLDAAAEMPEFFDEDAERDSFPALLMRLKPKYREALYLHYCEDYSVEETAVILGRSPNTIKTLLRRGRQMIKEIYGGEYCEEST